MNEPFGSSSGYSFTVAVCCCQFCAVVFTAVFRIAYCSAECQSAFRTGLHERVDELFGL